MLLFRQIEFAYLITLFIKNNILKKINTLYSINCGLPATRFIENGSRFIKMQQINQTNFSF